MLKCCFRNAITAVDSTEYFRPLFFLLFSLSSFFLSFFQFFSTSLLLFFNAGYVGTLEARSLAKPALDIFDAEARYTLIAARRAGSRGRKRIRRG